MRDGCTPCAHSLPCASSHAHVITHVQHQRCRASPDTAPHSRLSTTPHAFNSRYPSFVLPYKSGSASAVSQLYAYRVGG
eukprot:3937585-Rhodomonas_salina.1